jgi:hypothetical protein
MRIPVACGAVLMGVLGLCMLAGAHREAPLVGYQKLGDDVSGLEATVASRADDADALAELADRYIERDAPGLALAAIERAPSTVRATPRVSHLWAVALMHEGRATDGLAREREAIAACGERKCAPWLLASAMRHEQFLSALVQRGVEDYRRDPDAAEAAYRRLSRTVVAVLDSPQAR